MFLLEPKIAVNDYLAMHARFLDYCQQLDLTPADRHFAWKELTEDDDFHEWPIPAGAFFSDPYYVGTEVMVRPPVGAALDSFFSPRNLYEVVLMIAGIGSGKSFSGSLGLTYVLYELSCLKRPQRWLTGFPHVSMSGDAEIVLMNASAAGKKQSGIVFGEVGEKIAAAPYFQHHFEPYAGKSSELLFPGNIRLSPGSSKWETALGWNLFFFVVDEAAFGIESERADYVRELFLAFNERRRSRWGRMGGGMLLTSPGSEYAYVEVIAGNAAEWDNTTMVWRACTWESKEELVAGCQCFLVERDPDGVRVIDKDMVFEGYDEDGNGVARRANGDLVRWRVKVEQAFASDPAMAA